MNRFAFVAACLVFATAQAGDGPTPLKATKPPVPSVQIAILLDTSGSMEGLLAQAKTQLWNIVNEFVRAKKDGKAPTIQVALFRSTARRPFPRVKDFVRQILPLTDDLDKVSEELFALKTRGGEEYCGWVIREAVKNLEWSKTGDVYKAISSPATSRSRRGRSTSGPLAGRRSSGGSSSTRSSAGRTPPAVPPAGRMARPSLMAVYMSIDQNQQVVEISRPPGQGDRQTRR